MEIKTCEEYVIARLEDLEKENGILKNRLEVAETRVAKLEKIIEKVKEILIKHSLIKTFKSDGVINRYIALDVNEWQETQKYAFDKLMRFTDYRINEEKKED